MKELTEIEDKVYQIHRACSNIAFSNGWKEYQLRMKRIRNELNLSVKKAKEVYYQMKGKIDALQECLKK